MSHPPYGGVNHEPEWQRLVRRDKHEVIYCDYHGDCYRCCNSTGLCISKICKAKVAAKPQEVGNEKTSAIYST